MISKQTFGRTGHLSTRILFGAYALNNASQLEADRTLALLMDHGVNHIDTAPMYGDAEKRIGSWMDKYRENFFIATKTRSRSYEGAWKNLRKSMDQLRVDYVDLWQMHGLTNPAGWEKAMGPGGTLEAFLEAREKGLVRFLGVTGHGGKTARMHQQSLGRFEFDSVMLPYNYLMLQKPRYAEEFEALIATCQARDIAVQTIKSIGRRPWKDRPKTHNTYFYEPLVEQAAINKAVHWALGLDNSFVITAGDLQLLPKIMDAAKRFTVRPSEDVMEVLVEKNDIQPIFSY